MNCYKFGPALHQAPGPALTIRTMTKLRRILIGLVLACVTAVPAAPSIARERDRDRGGDGRMSREERQRLRDDMQSTRRDVYRDERRQPSYYPPPPPPPGQRMSPQDREQLRRDMYDANRGMPRR